MHLYSILAGFLGMALLLGSILILPSYAQIESAGNAEKINTDDFGGSHFEIEDIKVWRAQIEIKVGDINKAGTNDDIFVQLNNENLTWLEFAQDDFKRDSRFTYDLLVPDNSTIGNIAGLAIGLEGKSNNSDTDGICIEEITFLINNHPIYMNNYVQDDNYLEEFDILCKWIDPDDKIESDFILIAAEEMKDSTLWQDFKNPPPEKIVTSEVIEDRLEGWMGHWLYFFPPYEYGRLNGDEYVEIRAMNTTHFEVDFDLKQNLSWSTDLGIEYEAIYRVHCWKENNSYGIVPILYKSESDRTWYGTVAGYLVNTPRMPLSIFSDNPIDSEYHPPTPPPRLIFGLDSGCPASEIKENGDIHFDFQEGITNLPGGDKVKINPDDVFNSEIFSDDFNRPDNPNVENGWIETENIGSNVNILNESLDFQTDDSPNIPIIAHSFPLQESGTVVWEFTWDFSRTGPENDYEIWMQLGESLHTMQPQVNESSGVAVNMKTGGTSNGFSNPEGFGVIDSSGVLNEIGVLSGTGGFNPGGIVNFQIILNLDSKTYDLAVTGPGVIGAADIIQSGISFSDNVNIDSIRFYLDSIEDNNFGNMRLDSIDVYKGNQNSQKTLDFWQKLKQNRIDLKSKLNPIDFGSFASNPNDNMDTVIPLWIKKSIGQWGYGFKNDDNFVSDIQYLIENKFIIPDSQYRPEEFGKSVLPYWLKNITQWWVSEKFSDKEFLSNIEYLIKNRIL